MNDEYNEEEFEKAFQEAEELEQEKIRKETEAAYSQYLSEGQQYHSKLAEYEKTLQTDDDDYYELERKRREQEEKYYWEEQLRQQDEWDEWDRLQEQAEADAEFDAFCEQLDEWDRLEDDRSIAEMEALGLY